MSCPLVRLPTEVLLRIFEQAKPIDAVCLALASKRLVQVSTMLTIRVPSVAKHRCTHWSSCPDIYKLLRRFQPRVDRYKVHDTKFGLCCDCLRYRLRKPAHWKPFARKYRRTRGVTAARWNTIVDGWRTHYYAQCPECYCKEHYQERPALPQHSMRLRNRSTISQ